MVQHPPLDYYDLLRIPSPELKKWGARRAQDMSFNQATHVLPVLGAVSGTPPAPPIAVCQALFVM